MVRHYIYTYIIISISGVIVKVLKEETAYLDQLITTACLKTGDVSATEKTRINLADYFIYTFIYHNNICIYVIHNSMCLDCLTSIISETKDHLEMPIQVR